VRFPRGTDQLWVSDLTFVPTWAGVAYICFIVDAHSLMIVGRLLSFAFWVDLWPSEPRPSSARGPNAEPLNRSGAWRFVVPDALASSMRQCSPRARRARLQ
jgi:hypothetical protein